MTYQNLGKLAVDLDLEDKVLEEGLLPEKMIEKSAFATAIIDRLIEKGNWLKASKLLFKDGPIKHVYDGDKGDLEVRIVRAIDSKDFDMPIYDMDKKRQSRENMQFLIKNISLKALDALLSREDLPADITEELITNHGPALGPEVYSTYLTGLGKRVQKENISYAYRLFKTAHNNSEIQKIYDNLESNFDIKNVPFMLTIAEESYEPGSKEKVEKIVGRSIPLFEQMDNEGGEEIISEINRVIKKYHLNISDTNKEAIETAEIKYSSSYVIRKRYESISPERRLSWAKAKWGSDHSLAYQIFVEENHLGEEALLCAKSLFEEEYKPRKHLSDSFKLKKEHLEAILLEVPQEDYPKREAVALKLGDKKELLRLAGIYSDSRNVGKANPLNNLEKAYELLKAAEADETTVRDLRKRMIEKGLEERRNTEYGAHFSWLRRDDIEGYRQVFDLLVQESDYKFLEYAYGIAKEKNDPVRVITARDSILNSVSPLKSVKFFELHQDPIGYDSALEALSKEYSLPKGQVNQLIVGKAKPKQMVR